MGSDSPFEFNPATMVDRLRGLLNRFSWINIDDIEELERLEFATFLATINRDANPGPSPLQEFLDALKQVFQIDYKLGGEPNMQAMFLGQIQFFVDNYPLRQHMQRFVDRVGTVERGYLFDLFCAALLAIAYAYFVDLFVFN